MKFPDGWYPRLRNIAHDEVWSLAALGVPLEHEDAEQHAVIEAWLAMSASDAIDNPYGFARTAMRRRLRSTFVRDVQTYGRAQARHEPTTIILDDGDEAPHPELLVDPWAAVEDRIAFVSLLTKPGAPQPPDDGCSRQAKQQWRDRFLRFSLASQSRPYDAP